MKPEKKALWMIWHYAYMDSRGLFANVNDGKKGILITQSDINEMCIKLKSKLCENLRVVPIDPSKRITRDNMRLVSMEDRSVLAKIWRRTNNAAIYEEMLSKLPFLS